MGVIQCIVEDLFSIAQAEEEQATRELAQS